MDGRLSDADFEVLELLGTGAFSSVFLARYKKSGNLYALKRLIWTVSPERILNEVRSMRKLDHPNIVKLLCFYRDKERVTLVLEYIPHVPFRRLLLDLTPLHVKCYMYQLLLGLAHIHERHIIHRDVKPSNFLFDPVTNRGRSIDCGLCEADISIMPVSPATEEDLKRVQAGKTPSDLKQPHLASHKPKMIWNRAGTRGFRAPEVLMGAWNQSAKIDVWSAGVILLCMLTRRYPFFKAAEDVVSLCEAAAVVGSHRLELAGLESLRRVAFPFVYKETDLRELVVALNPRMVTEDWDNGVFDLLYRLLEPIPTQRITAADATKHAFFNGIPDELRIGENV